MNDHEEVAVNAEDEVIVLSPSVAVNVSGTFGEAVTVIVQLNVPVASELQAL